MLVFEITEDGTSISDGERLAYLPGRGFHRTTISANGDVVVGEERLRGLMNRARTADDFQHGLTELLGTPGTPSSSRTAKVATARRSPCSTKSSDAASRVARRP